MTAQSFNLDAEQKVVFGFYNRDHSLEILRQTLPQTEFDRSVRVLSLHQTHSSDVVKRPTSLELGTSASGLVSSVPNPEPQADAHWTDQIDVVLAVKTADCIPILGVVPALDSSEPNIVFAIHAGWRGVAGQIVQSTFKSLESALGLRLKTRGHRARVFLGPHIRKESFQIRADALGLLEAAAATVMGPADRRQLIEQTGPDRFHFDLESLVIAQLKACGVDHENIETSMAFDTVTSLQYHSYRRDSQQSGRNISWIGLTTRRTSD